MEATTIYDIEAFKNNLRGYGIAISKRDFTQAKERLILALENNPAPELNGYFAQEMIAVETLMANEVVLAKPKGFFAKFMRTLNEHGKQRELMDAAKPKAKATV